MPRLFIGLGLLALLSLVGLTVLAFYGLLRFSSDITLNSLADPYIHGIVWFSIKQAALSALLSVVLGYLIARALYYSPQLRGRAAFLSLCLLAFVMPTLVLVTGLVALLGRNGWLSPFLGADWNLYGLQGILLAHLYLNIPFVIRAIVLQLQAIPESSWRLALQLKLSPWQRWRYMELPSVGGRLIVLAGFVFVLCFNSFAVVLALGGGPQATTLEVAIYQALKYDFNISEALVLAWLQFGIAGVLFAVLARFSSGAWLSPDTGTQRYLPTPSPWVRGVYVLLYGGAWVLLVLPILTLIVEVWGLGSGHWQSMQLLKPTLVTLGLALASAVSTVVMAYLVLIPVRQAVLARQRVYWLWEWLSLHNLVAPAMVLSVGIYIVVLRVMDLEHWGLVWVGIINTALLVPFAVQQLKPQVLQFDAQYENLVLTLKLSWRARLSVELPWLRDTLGAAGVLVLLLAMGEVSIFAIFGTEQATSLPWLIYSYASTYRLPEAALASLVLLVLCGGIVGLWEYMQVRNTKVRSIHVSH
ncbi:ABC transporter permease subunit [Thiofilum flexile]|uniref:ABC transporter permease subunit n=1 Tax=Thiofilum flexile TaxID=125627 RepID=UPI00036C41F8|nr:ABC transporter permease subunit [Thiofilum flexile]